MIGTDSRAPNAFQDQREESGVRARSPYQYRAQTTGDHAKWRSRHNHEDEVAAVYPKGGAAQENV